VRTVESIRSYPVLGISKKFMTEMFGSGGDIEEKSRVRRLVRIMKWGGLFVTFICLVGFMLFEIGIGAGLITPAVQSEQSVLPDVPGSVEELLGERRDEIERALKNGTIDEELRKRNVPEKMRNTLKDELARQLDGQATTSPR
jgi:hypothetical protein